MIARTLLSLLLLTTIVSGCSLLPQRQVEIVSKPVQIDIIQPELPRPIDLTDVQMSVVSEAVIINPCKRSISFEPKRFDDKGVEQLKRPKACDLEDRENPNWPVGYTYLDRFLDENKIAQGGDIVFVATTVKDYEIMTANFQELRRYIRELGEVIVYYRKVTTNNKEEKATKSKPVDQ
jgi:hypothetical protein|tara:strand:+ start:6278 stop:6811 length:534 start_codon:yes stop_codon:yes gene_type:complete